MRQVRGRFRCPELREESIPGWAASSSEFADQLYACETLNPPGEAPKAEATAEPYSLQWFLNIEDRRHRRQGRWIPRVLEFSKHAGETLLGLGNSLGTDWLQYARHGAAVVVCSSSSEQLRLVRRNFELRGLNARFLHSAPASLAAGRSIDRRRLCQRSYSEKCGNPKRSWTSFIASSSPAARSWRSPPLTTTSTTGPTFASRGRGGSASGPKGKNPERRLSPDAPAPAICPVRRASRLQTTPLPLGRPSRLAVAAAADSGAAHGPRAGIEGVQAVKRRSSRAGDRLIPSALTFAPVSEIKR